VPTFMVGDEDGTMRGISPPPGVSTVEIFQ
jgi:hypothetical protein